MSTHSSAARVLANQLNAIHSTGPVTPAGKAKASLNAVTTGLTGRTVLLATDDKAVYERHLSSYRKEFQPANEIELSLVQVIADADWRLQRISSLIIGFEAKGRQEIATEHEDVAPANCPNSMDLDGYLRYEKQIRNLCLQEGRLHRRREKDLAELRAMQKARQDRHARELAEAADLYAAAKHDNEPFHPADHGFEFSVAEIEAYGKKTRANLLAKQHASRTTEAA